MKLSFKNTEFVPAGKIAIPSIYYDRMKTGIGDIDDFMGGREDDSNGFLRGGVYILAAGAGSGKSTFCLQVAEALTNRKYRVAFASGEESIEQLAFTCNRLNVQNVPVAVQSDLDILLEKMSSLDMLIIDSFQALTLRKHMTSRKKEHYCIAKICERAKQTKCTVIVLCHLTKQGTYKGSTTLLHAADALINITIHEEVPTLRVFTWGKNRFGPADRGIEVELTKNGYRWSSGTYKAKPAADVVQEEQKLIKEGADIILDLVGL